MLPIWVGGSRRGAVLSVGAVRLGVELLCSPQTRRSELGPDTHLTAIRTPDQRLGIFAGLLGGQAGAEGDKDSSGHCVDEPLDGVAEEQFADPVEHEDVAGKPDKRHQAEDAAQEQ